jgi:hypothetical protein
MPAKLTGTMSNTGTKEIITTIPTRPNNRVSLKNRDKRLTIQIVKTNITFLLK